MPNYIKILAEIQNQQWAINRNAMEGILSAIDGNIGPKDYEVFHQASKQDYSAVMGKIGTKVENTRHSFINGKNAFLFIDGPIIPRADFFSEISGLVSVERLSSEFAALEADNDIKRIVLMMDTPGGSVTGISDFSQTIAKSKKETSAFVFGMAASAGYWIASSTGNIISTDTGIVGSIGVVSTIRKMKDDSIEIVSSQSPNKRLDIETKDGKAAIQTVLDDLADVFISHVASMRGVSSDTVIKDFGGGGVSVANRAMKAGMIDGVMSLDDFIKSLDDGIEPIIQGETEKPVSAGLKKENIKMGLKTAIKENPSIQAEVDALAAAAKTAGIEEQKAEQKTRTEAASKYVNNASYPATVHEVAANVMAGTQSIETMTALVQMCDTHAELNKSKLAIAESSDMGTTPPDSNSDSKNELSTINILRDADGSAPLEVK